MAALYELFDSDNPLAIPLGVKAAGYDDGYAANAWAVYGWARFPDALHITVFGLPDSDVFDIETGDGLPWQAGPWAAQRKARGKIAIPYCERVNGHAVEDSLRASSISTAEAMLWIATDDGTQVVTEWLDGTPVTYPVWAVQYLNEAHGSGGHFDRSLVYLAFGAGGGIIGEVVNPSEKYALVRAARAAGQGPDQVARKADGSIDTAADDAAIIAFGNQITDDGSNADVIIRQFFDPANAFTARWMQIAADLKAGKYALKADLPSSPSDDDSQYALKTHTHPGTVSVGPSQ